jgi:hypothetical protein
VTGPPRGLLDGRRHGYGAAVLVVVQHPIVDIRGMLTTPSGMIGTPDWVTPEHLRNEFVRGLGAVRKRERKGIQPWPGEGYYVDSRAGLRFASTTQWSKELGSEFKPVFRRYFSDGTVGRLEVGLRTPWLLGAGVDSEPGAAAIGALRVPVRVGDAKPTPFVEIGERFARFFLEATTVTEARRRPDRVEFWWTAAGSPLAVCELDPEELTPSAAAEVSSHLANSEPGSVLVEQRWLTVDGFRVSLWFVIARPDSAPEVIRRLRIHVSRLHAEHEAFRAVLRLCAHRKLDVDASDDVRTYIDERAGLLLRRHFAGFPQKELLEMILDRWEAGYEDDLTTMRVVEARLTSVGLSRKLDGVASLVGPRASAQSGAGNQFILTQGAVLQVTYNDHSVDQSVSVSGNTGPVAGVQGGGGNEQSIGSIQQTVNDLPQLARDLVGAVSELRGQLPDEQVDEVSDYASAIQDEAQKATPDKGKITRFLDKITSWGKKVGPPALSVLSVAAQIVAAVAAFA